MRTPSVIVVANHKGGVGKTTSAVCLAHTLADLGHATLLIDCDPQNNTSQCFPTQAQAVADDMTLCAVLKGEVPNSSAMQCVRENLYLLGSTPELSRLEKVLGAEDTHPFWLAEQLSDPLIQAGIAYVVIDTPPSVNAMTVTALGAATDLFIPMRPEPFAFSGMEKLLATVARVQKHFNPRLRLKGVFLTRYATTYRGTVFADFTQALKELPGLTGQLMQTTIRENVRLVETQADTIRESIHTWAPGSNGSEDYKALTAEILTRI